MRMYPVELPPVRRKKLNFRDHARRSWAMTATRPPAESRVHPQHLPRRPLLRAFDYPLFEPFSSPRRPVLAMVVIAKDFLDSGFRRNDGWGSAIIV